MAKIEDVKPVAIKVSAPKALVTVTSTSAKSSSGSAKTKMAGDRPALSSAAKGALRRFDGGQPKQVEKAPADKGFAQALVESAKARARMVQDAAHAEFDRLRRKGATPGAHKGSDAEKAAKAGYE